MTSTACMSALRELFAQRLLERLGDGEEDGRGDVVERRGRRQRLDAQLLGERLEHARQLAEEAEHDGDDRRRDGGEDAGEDLGEVSKDEVDHGLHGASGQKKKTLMKWPKRPPPPPPIRPPTKLA